MSGCLLAQQLARRVDRLSAENAELRELIMLMADAAGIDVATLLLRTHVARRGGYVATFAEAEALGLHHHGGDAA